MKNFKMLIAALIVLSMSSCRKDRTCTCTSSTNGGTATTKTIVVKKATKNAANGGNCASGTDTYTSGGTTYVSTNTCTFN